VFLLIGGASLLVALFGFYPFTAPEKEVAGLSSLEVSNFPSLTPTLKPTSTPTPTPTIKPSPAEVSKKPTQDLLQQINAFRSGKGLSPLSANSETCFFANIRSQEIIASFNHDGFENRIDSNTLPYPSYSSVAENIAMNPDPNQVVPGWISSPGHNENLSKDVPYGCVVSNGEYYVFEAWRP